ncbi:MAG: CHAT domain-containing protein [Myxococcales bacterium]|nr:CHAT domain-containing protein [Myxococcales bacterium]
MAFDDWQGRTVYDVLATSRSSTVLDSSGAANQLARLGDWLRVASPAAFARANRTSVLRTMHEIDLLALIVADGEVWRLTASHGPPQLARVASLAELQDPLEAFRTQPTHGKVAAGLGALLVPEEAFLRRETLHVVLDWKLGSLPLAALRHGGVPLIAVRPIVHALRLPEVRCVRAQPPGHATVIGVSGPRIPNAVVEADEVAALLHTSSVTGANATKEALFAAANDAVLHVAAHAELVLDGAGLVLGDGEVSALEISARRVGPALAVLSACHAAVSDDGELGGSLVAAFLGSGSQHVVATLRPVSDAGVPHITTQFYREGGVADPVRALATVQAKLAMTDNADWPYFAVFGSAVCQGGTLDRE